MSKHDGNHSTGIPGLVLMAPKIAPLPSELASQSWEARRTLQVDLQSKECVRGGEGGLDGGRERREQNQPKIKKGREKSEAGLFLSSLPSIQQQQGRSTTVASRKAQKKKKNLTSVF